MKTFQEFINDLSGDNLFSELLSKFTPELKDFIKQGIKQGLVEDGEFLKELKHVYLKLDNYNNYPPVKNKQKEFDLVARPESDSTSANDHQTADQ